jgi:hypothetical protein
MKSPIKHRPHSTKRWMLALLAAAAVSFAVNTASAADAGVLQVSSKQYYGQTYNQWVVSYWQWAMSIPFSINPWANDPTGANSGVDQSGPVWFLGGTLGDSVTRSVTIPAGKAIFLPVHQWIFGATVGDCDPSNPGVTCDVQTLRKSAADATKAVALMEVTIDGQSISNVKDYRVTSSPQAFSVTLPSDNVPISLGLPVPAGTYTPQVADGYYMLLSPPSSGAHVITVHVVSSLGFEYALTYNITVQ